MDLEDVGGELRTRKPNTACLLFTGRSTHSCTNLHMSNGEIKSTWCAQRVLEMHGRKDSGRELKNNILEFGAVWTMKSQTGERKRDYVGSSTSPQPSRTVKVKVLFSITSGNCHGQSLKALTSPPESQPESEIVLKRRLRERSCARNDHNPTTYFNITDDSETTWRRLLRGERPKSNELTWWVDSVHTSR